MAGVDEMNCDELVEKVTDYLEQALSSPDLARWDDHVQVCIGCQGHLGEVRVALRVLSSLATERMSNEMESALLASYREWTGSVSL